jgi:hypothetical protein
VIKRSSIIDGAQFNEPNGINRIDLHPTILSKFVSSNPSECPVLTLEWQLFDGTPVNNNEVNNTNHTTVKLLNPHSSCWLGTPIGGASTQAECTSLASAALLDVNNT